jgi:integrase
VTFRGTPAEARKKLRELLKSGDDGTHVEPTRMTLGEWAEHWLSIGCPGRKKKRVSRRSLERYEQLMRVHVIPALGAKKLQQLHPTDIDQLYQSIEGKLAPNTAHMAHTVFAACLSAAVRKGLLITNPITRAEKILSPVEADHGLVLDKDQIAALVQSFEGNALHPIIAVAAFTGARRNEILALQWRDLDPVAKTLRIERSLEETKGEYRFKEPKRAKHKRTIQIDDALVQLLLSVRESHQRLIAGVPDGVAVDLSLIKLPADALMFPSFYSRDFDGRSQETPNGLTVQFERHAQKMFPDIRFHDLRGSHETALLDAGVPARTNGINALDLHANRYRHSLNSVEGAMPAFHRLRQSTAQQILDFHRACHRAPRAGTSHPEVRRSSTLPGRIVTREYGLGQKCLRFRFQSRATPSARVPKTEKTRGLRSRL